jgi:hypothetical protein
LEALAPWRRIDENKRVIFSPNYEYSLCYELEYSHVDIFMIYELKYSPCHVHIILGSMLYRSYHVHEQI